MGWKWPRSRSNATREIIALTPPTFLSNPSQCDRIIRLPSKTGVYSTKSAWEAIRHSNRCNLGGSCCGMVNMFLDGVSSFGKPCREGWQQGTG